jgi:modulator of FtsH protease
MVMLLYVAGGLTLACGQPAGLYLLLPATLVALISGILNAWLFLLPPPPGGRPVRDSGHHDAAGPG